MYSKNLTSNLITPFFSEEKPITAPASSPAVNTPASNPTISQTNTNSNQFSATGRKILSQDDPRVQKMMLRQKTQQDQLNSGQLKPLDKTDPRVRELAHRNDVDYYEANIRPYNYDYSKPLSTQQNGKPYYEGWQKDWYNQQSNPVDATQTQKPNMWDNINPWDYLKDHAKKILNPQYMPDFKVQYSKKGGSLKQDYRSWEKEMYDSYKCGGKTKKKSCGGEMGKKKACGGMKVKK